MDLKRIRNMSDDELERYLKSLADKKSNNCLKCEKPNSNYTMNIQNKKNNNKRNYAIYVRIVILIC